MQKAVKEVYREKSYRIEKPKKLIGNPKKAKYGHFTSFDITCHGIRSENPKKSKSGHERTPPVTPHHVSICQLEIDRYC
jgi:hypothetical protein